MPKANSPDSRGIRLLRLFQKLMFEGRKHYQSDLADYLECSPQTVSRLIGDIEETVGTGLEIGTKDRRRYYQLKTLASRRTLGLEFEELRYLTICHDLASPHLPQQISERVEKTIFELSTLMADPDYARRDDAQQPQIGFKSKGYIDYTDHYKHIESLIDSARKRNVCLVDYKAGSKKDQKTYFYAPGRIVSMNGALYVRGHKVSKGLAEKERATTLAIHRIKDVIQTDKKFNFDATIDDAGSFGMSWHDPKRFRIAFDEKAADYVRERIWSEDQKIEEQEDGGLVLELSTVSERELLAWVWSFGELARVIEQRNV